jgi:hypothetical protein
MHDVFRVLQVLVLHAEKKGQCRDDAKKYYEGEYAREWRDLVPVEHKESIALKSRAYPNAIRKMHISDIFSYTSQGSSVG